MQLANRRLRLRASRAERLLSPPRLRVAGSLQNVVQSADEIAGVAEAFDDLGDELTNNRIDNPDLKSRLREQIARPLHQIAEQRMPQLAAQLKLVEEHIEDPAATAPRAEKSIALADEILVEMRQVLDRMLELETYNEVVALAPRHHHRPGRNQPPDQRTTKRTPAKFVPGLGKFRRVSRKGAKRKDKAEK